jgi:hypothetical protein
MRLTHLTRTEIRRMRKLYREGIKISQLKVRFGRSGACVKRAIRGARQVEAEI